MCALCQRAVLKLRKKTGWSQGDAVGFLWSNTSFPVGDGLMVMDQVNTFLRVQPKNRAKWFRRQDREMTRLMEAPDAS